MGCDFALVSINRLLRHEEVVPEHVLGLTLEIARDGELRQPIILDRHSLVILDGHHRAEALRRLGCTLVPAYLVDYSSPLIAVETRRTDQVVTKETVIATGLAGRLFPPKTSRHLLPGVPARRPVALELLREPPESDAAGLTAVGR